MSSTFAISCSLSLRVLSLVSIPSEHTHRISSEAFGLLLVTTVAVDCNPTEPRGQTPCFELYLLEIYFYSKVVRIQGAVGKSPCRTVKHLQRICDSLTPGLVSMQRTHPLLYTGHSRTLMAIGLISLLTSIPLSS